MKSMRLPVFVLSLAPGFAAEPITGRASVVDGDTLDIAGTRIRLHGIDGPESAQLCEDGAGKNYRCGQAAALALADLIGSTPVSCDPRDTDKYRRTVAVCRKSAEDLNGWMVAQGQAVAYRRYSMDYVNAEMAAKIIKRGIWAGTFQQPEERRRAKREGSAEARQEPTRTGGCAIKGNTSRKGEKVFHVPGSRDYDRTRISVKGGERMFCSEDEAEAAGWRAPRR
ncbi:thermonuclease family protein [Methylobacterium sp.]|uniref:thermonuclease family protein n=1 Tax=Methylobacterium sp. TaxID=409 RepID=UPI003C73BBED